MQERRASAEFVAERNVFHAAVTRPGREHTKERKGAHGGKHGFPP
jgi:hypothetical protein